jgi:hypothetical protein
MTISRRAGTGAAPVGARVGERVSGRPFEQFALGNSCCKRDWEIEWSKRSQFIDLPSCVTS